MQKVKIGQTELSYSQKLNLSKHFSGFKTQQVIPLRVSKPAKWMDFRKWLQIKKKIGGLILGLGSIDLWRKKKVWKSNSTVP